jgi:hypothetical protein
MPAQARGQPGDVAQGCRGDAVAGAFRAELREHRPDRLQRGDLKRFGAAGRLDRVEHQRRNVLGVARRILLGDLRAIGDAVEHELFIARRRSDRLDVGDRFGGRIQPPRRPELERAAFKQLPHRADPSGAARAVERGTAERPRFAGAALVEDEQVAPRERRAQCLGEKAGERQRRLPRSAGERNHSFIARCRAGLQALELQRERPGG